jgi:Family of unknown function (DUF5343)
MVRDEQSAAYMPYAPAAPVLSLIHRLREGRLPDPLTVQILPSVGIAEGNADRVHKAIQHLGLIDEDGVQTAAAASLARVATSEYEETLRNLVTNAYSAVFSIVDPRVDTEIQIQDAFRPYQPAAQRARMVSLFSALCRESGIIEGGPVDARVRRVRAPRSTSTTRKPASTSTELRNPASTSAPVDDLATPTGAGGAVDLRLLAAIIQQIPRDGRWSQGRRDRWISAMTSAVDLVTEVIESEQA